MDMAAVGEVMIGVDMRWLLAAWGFAPWVKGAVTSGR
jgi:hypothetical protein